MTDIIILPTSQLESKTWAEIQAIESPQNQTHYYDSTNERRVCYLTDVGWIPVNYRGPE